MAHIARKRFGQHFLVDGSCIAALVREIDPQPDDAMVEIGPGLGALTEPLAQRVNRLTVIELDRDLAARWRRAGTVQVIEADVLKVDFSSLAPTALRIVGNLPYNISSPILFQLLPLAAQVLDQHFMLQAEVVDRIVAPPSSAAYGRLSVMLQWRYHVERVLEVPPEAFDPPPRVHSAVVRMTPRADAVRLDATLFSELVAAAFSQRRKLLRHSLGVWLEQRLEQKQAAPQFDLRRRAEEVPVAEYAALAAALSTPTDRATLT